MLCLGGQQESLLRHRITKQRVGALLRLRCGAVQLPKEDHRILTGWYMSRGDLYRRTCGRTHRLPVGPKCAHLRHIVLTHNELKDRPWPAGIPLRPATDEALDIALHLLEAVLALDLGVGVSLDGIQGEVPDLRNIRLVQDASGHRCGQVGGIGVDLDLAKHPVPNRRAQRSLPDAQEVRMYQRLPQPEEHQRVEAGAHLAEILKHGLSHSNVEVASLLVMRVALLGDRAVHAGQAAPIGQLEDQV